MQTLVSLLPACQWESCHPVYKMSGFKSREYRILAVVLTVLTGIVVILLFVFDPSETRIFPPCPSWTLFRIYCPGCGNARAFHNLLNGRFVAAFRLNPGMVILAPFLVALLVKPKWAYKPWVAWSAFIFLMLYSILRNLPFWPFNLLAPK